MASNSPMNIVMGAMTFGGEGKPQVRVHDVQEVGKILDVFVRHGHNEVDTARVYGEGTSEEYLAKVGWKERGLIMDTKLYPFPGHPMFPHLKPITHKAEDIRKNLDDSLKALNTDKIEIFYLHAPDRNTPFEETLKAIDEEHKKGKFNRFDISNFYSWEVAEVVTLCRANGWIAPTAYQGVYNAMHRAVEPELFPCLRKFGIAFYAFNPLGGGFFTGRYKKMDETSQEGRFDATTVQGKAYRDRYWTENYFKALQIVDAAASEAGLTMSEVALRWMTHHSLMKRDYGDSVIIGASSVKHLEQNLVDLEKDALPEEVVRAVDEAWSLVKGQASKYWH